MYKTTAKTAEDFLTSCEGKNEDVQCAEETEKFVTLEFTYHSLPVAGPASITTKGVFFIVSCVLVHYSKDVLYLCESLGTISC